MNEKEELEILVKESSSLSEILRKQNKSNSGTALKVLKNKLNSYGIDYHFLDEKSISKKLELDEILVNGKNYSSKRLKDRLIKAGIKEDVCEICGISEWMGKKLTLQLHHINGVHNDNRLENLQILCPNCHSLTDNFGNKKTKEIKLCPDCGKEINNKSTYCKNCAPKHKHHQSKCPSKEELSGLIFKYSFVEIGKKYGVSDNAVRKWCKKYNLPFTKREIRDFIHNVSGAIE